MLQQKHANQDDRLCVHTIMAILASSRSARHWIRGFVEAVGPIEPMAKKIERMVDDKRRGLQRVQSQKRKAPGSMSCRVQGLPQSHAAIGRTST